MPPKCSGLLFLSLPLKSVHRQHKQSANTFFFQPKVLLYPGQATAGQKPHLPQNGGLDDCPSHWFVL